jgi:hypothetical protein
MLRYGKIKDWDQGCLFQVIITGAGQKKIYTLKIECGPGDVGEPVLTIDVLKPLVAVEVQLPGEEWNGTCVKNIYSLMVRSIMKESNTKINPAPQD